MRTTTWIAIASLFALAFVATSATAHESYEIGDGEYTLTVGDQNEPIYTYKWTNLDLIIRDSAGDPVDGAHETLNGTLIAPGGEELDGTLEGQFGEEGRYEFSEGHFYTQPGQYTLHLEGEINGTDATGEYDLPGPRESMSSFGFPHEEVPTIREIDDRLAAVEDGGGGVDAQRVESLETQVSELESQIQQLEQRVEAAESGSEQTADAPGLGVGAALGAIAAVGLAAARRDA